MKQVSAVIISKNEARIISKTIIAAQQIAEEVLVVDTFFRATLSAFFLYTT